MGLSLICPSETAARFYLMAMISWGMSKWLLLSTICYTSMWTVFKADSLTWEYMRILSTSWFFVLSACQAICTYIQIWNGFPSAIYQLQVLINSMAERDESRECSPLRPFPQGNSTRFEHRNLENLCTILSISHTAWPGALYQDATFGQTYLPSYKTVVDLQQQWWLMKIPKAPAVRFPPCLLRIFLRKKNIFGTEMFQDYKTAPLQWWSGSASTFSWYLRNLHWSQFSILAIPPAFLFKDFVTSKYWNLRSEDKTHKLAHGN